MIGRLRTRFRTGDIVIESAIALPGLVVRDETGSTPDIRVAISEVGFDQSDSAGARVLEEVVPFGRDGRVEVIGTPSGRIVRWVGVGDVLIASGGREILVKADHGPADPRLGSFLVNQVLSFVLAYHGREGLHASAVQMPGSDALVFVGMSGAGKSTFAAAGVSLGARLLADDLAIVGINGSGPYIGQSTVRVNLYPAVARALGLADSSSANGADKQFVAVPGAHSITPRVNIETIYVLHRSSTAEIPEVSEPLPLGTGTMALLASCYNTVLRTRERLAVHFDVLTRLAAAVPIRNLRWNPRPETARNFLAGAANHERAAV